MNNKELWTKEFVYSQWRKLLCFFVVDRDINHFDDGNNLITNEQLRTVFNNGYKMAMLQAKESIETEMLKIEDKSKSIDTLIKLVNEIDERILVSNCYEHYKNKDSLALLEKVRARDEEFNEYKKRSLSTWTEFKM